MDIIILRILFVCLIVIQRGIVVSAEYLLSIIIK